MAFFHKDGVMAAALRPPSWNMLTGPSPRDVMNVCLAVLIVLSMLSSAPALFTSDVDVFCSLSDSLLF